MTCLFVFLGVGKVAVDLGERIVKLLFELLSGFLGLETVVVDLLELEVVDNKAGGHDMVLIDIFDEGLNSGLSDELLLVVTALGSKEVSANSGNEEMGESVALGEGRGTLLPVSMVLTTIAFLPANLPRVITTTRPVLKLNEGRCTFCPWLWIN